MNKSACFSLAVRAHKLHINNIPFLPSDKRLKSWDEMSWFFLFLWGES